MHVASTTPSCKRKTDATETEATDTYVNGLLNRPKGERMKWKHPPTKLFSLKNVSRIAKEVQTLYETGKAAQAAREMERYKLDILRLNEVRWTSSGAMVLSSGQTLLYSGSQNENDNHQHGVGILLNKRAKSSLMEWNRISERIIMARFMSKVPKVTVIQCYTPTNVTEAEDKEEFYNQLQATRKDNST